MKPIIVSDPLRFPQIYLAGSYTNPEQKGIAANVRKALSAAKQIMDRYQVLPIVPHAMFLHHSTTWEEAMERCRDIISKLDPSHDVIIMLPGWHASKGATEERDLAISLGLKVFEYSDVIP